MQNSTDTQAISPISGGSNGTAKGRSLDDRLTLTQVRMVCVSLAFGGACFVFALIYLQLIDEHGMWKPSHLHQPSLFVGLVEMGVVVVSWIVYFWGQWAGLYARRFQKLTLALSISAVLGLVSIGFHIYELHHPGFRLQSAYAGVFIVTEAVYTAILCVAVLVLLALANRSRLGRFEGSGIAIQAFCEFWGFWAAVGVINFLALYLQPFLHSG